MPTTVTDSSGTEYHLWQLPDASAPEPQDTTEYTTIDNDLTDGYRSSALLGSETGVRKWTLKLPTLAALEVLPLTVTDPYGASLSREEYVRSVYEYNKTTGPFAYQCPSTGQYFLVDFEDKTLSMQRMKVKIYSTGLTLRQRRITGVTIFDAGRIPQVWGAFKGEGYPMTVPGPATAGWENQVYPEDLDTDILLTNNATDVVAATVNSQGVVRFSNTTNNAFLTASDAITVREVFLLMKMREASFSNNGGILTDNNTGYVLIGDTGTTKFFNHSLGTGFFYEKDDVEYAESNMQAPMNTWGIVHWKYPTGVSLANVQIGKDRNFAGRFAEVDFNYIVISEQILPRWQVNLIKEALGIRKTLLLA